MLYPMHLFLCDFVTSKNKQMAFSFLIVVLSGYTFIIMCANGPALTPVLEHTNKRYAKLRTALKANENSLSALHVIMGPRLQWRNQEEHRNTGPHFFFDKL